MNKIEFAKRIAARLSISQREALTFIGTYENILADALINEGMMVSQGFGTFTLWSQSERPGRNPQTGIPVTIPSRNSVKFKPGKGLLEYLNSKGKRKD